MTCYLQAIVVAGRKYQPLNPVIITISCTYMSSGMLFTPSVKAYMGVNNMIYIYVKTQVLMVMNIETTVFFGVMWHRVDRYHHSEEPAASFLLCTSFPCLSSSCISIFLPVKRTAAL
jgi:hypothetical protein